MVLIVDDKPENLFSLKQLLQLNNFEVDTASSGEEALQKILKRSYSLIVLDVQMPGMDGFEVAEAVTGYSKSKDIPIIFLSAVNTDKKFITKGYETGALDYVTKPVDPDILLLKAKTFTRLYDQTYELKKIQKALSEEVMVRKKAEDALSENVKQLHSFIESIPQIAFTTSSDGIIETVNDRWFHYAKQIDQFPAVHPDEPTIPDSLAGSLQTGETLERELRLRMLPDGAYRYHLLRVIPVTDAAGHITKWVGTFTDIHAQKQTNDLLEKRVSERTKELKKINEELEAKNHELQQFTSVASHDLKEPLRKIQVFSSIVLKKVAEEENDTQSLVTKIISASERMSGLINDLLTYSRLSIESFFQPTDLSLLVEEIIADLEIQIAEKNASITVGKLPVIDAIPGQIRQLFQNIISNALKFSRSNIPLQISITATSISEPTIESPRTKNGTYTRIAISDNGIGFDEEYLDKIFTIFQRLNPRERFEGTGIGLAIAKKIVDKHRGFITARSKENEGSTFYIILPAVHRSGKQTDLALQQ